MAITRTKALLVLADVVATGAGVLAAAAIRPPGPDGAIGAALLMVAWGVWMNRARLYSARFITRRADEIRRLLDAGALAAASVGVIAFAAGFVIDRLWLLLAVTFSAVLLSLERELVRRRYSSLRLSGRLRRRVLMIGDNSESRLLHKMFADDRSLGYDVIDTIDPSKISDPNELTTHVLATARAFDASGAVVAASAIDSASSNRLIRDLIEAGIHVELSSTLADINPGRLTVRPLGRFPVVYVEPVHRHGWRALAKRSFDLIVATAACIVLAPVFAAVAVAIRRGSAGPVFFEQSRVGQNGVPFDVKKFRTMVQNAEEIQPELEQANEGAGPLFKMKDDPRVTPTGRFLRRTSLDELPQLINVIRGEMSLVGPRPALASEMAEWEADLYGRLRVKPGITGMWQVSGRSETSFEEYTRLDLYYVDNWSLVIDLSILARTLPAVLRRDGAY